MEEDFSDFELKGSEIRSLSSRCHLISSSEDSKRLSGEVTFVSGPKEFYFRLRSEIDEYDVLRGALHNRFSGKFRNRLLSWSPGTTVVSYHDYGYYRCLVLDPPTQGFLLDVGKTVPIQKCYYLPSEFIFPPPLCIRCHLFYAPDIISDESLHQFKSFFNKVGSEYEELFIIIRNIQTHSEDSFSVELVASELVPCATGPTFIRDVYFMSLCSKIGLLDNVESPENISCLEKEPLEVNEESEVILNIPRKPIKCWKPPSVPLSQNPIDCRVTYVDNSGIIYFHFAHQIRDFRKVRSEAQFDASEESEDKPTKKTWCVGEACLAPFEDELYYRSFIVGLSSTIAGVFHVDYGSSENVKLKELKLATINDDIPVLALSGYLKGIAPVNDKTWSESWLDKIYSKLLYLKGGKTRVTILSDTLQLPLPIDLEIQSEDNVWISFNELLIQEDLAVKDTDDNFLDKYISKYQSTAIIKKGNRKTKMPNEEVESETDSLCSQLKSIKNFTMLSRYVQE